MYLHTYTHTYIHTHAPKYIHIRRAGKKDEKVISNFGFLLKIGETLMILISSDSQPIRNDFLY